MHVLFVQYGGDYREAVQRFEAGEEETYSHQKYSVEAVASLTETVEKVSVLCCLTSEAYCEVLSNDVQAIGMGFSETVDLRAVVAQVAAMQPDALVLRTPLRPLMRWAVKQKIPTLCVLADSFLTHSLRQRLKNYLLARLLNHPTIQWVANHNLPSSLSLKQIGVAPDKILPWDWPALTTPEHQPPKQLNTSRDASEPYTLFYAGMIQELKGVGDAIAAVALLTERNIPVRLSLAGSGNVDQFAQQAHDLGVADRVKFLGLIPNREVSVIMRHSDFILIPSRREYPEGMPHTIYEALCARTPIIASNHPVFRDRLHHKVSAMLFESGDSTTLADCIAELIEQPALYFDISQRTMQTWQTLQIPLKWDVVVKQWIQGLKTHETSLAKYALTSGQYATS